MKKELLSLALALTAVGTLQAKSQKDPVLMTINGKPVTLSEFEYLYHKNNSQQIAPQTIDEYLQMFITYKQKVADAEAAGIDKTQAFQTEFDGYRRELAAPYLIDQAVEDSIIAAEYARMSEEVDVSHIMVALQTPQSSAAEQQARLDSIRTAILNGSDFEQLARQFSIDRSVVRNGGHMGYITATRFPYTFEDAAYTTATGEISPVIRTPYGYHIVKVNGRRPAQGQVLVEHILKLTQGLSEEEATNKKAQIDSIYTLVCNGGDFEAIAKAESEDPGSASKGGKLPWFGSGQMVPEFEATSFALANGEISKPFATSYGYHIIHRLDGKGIEPFENVKSMIKNVISHDERGRMAAQRRLDALKKKHNVTVNKQNLDQIKSEIIANNGLDSILIAKYLTNEMPMATISKDKILLSEVIADISTPFNGTPEQQASQFEALLNREIDNATIEQERQSLAVENSDYRNLLNEYRDGMLLFEISDRNVWTKAKQDKEGLENFFQANRDKYRWEKPKFKSYIVFATSDSISQAAQQYLADNKVANDSLVQTLRRQFGKDVKVEKVIAAQGENAITDYLGFGGEKPEQKGKWKFYFPYLSRIIDNPEEAADERGAVTGDYQNLLEEQWVARLHELYPAKVNNKVLKKAK